MKIKPKVVKEVNVKEMRIHMKVRDEFGAAFFDSDGAKVGDYEGYVPSFMPDEHHGDYVALNIDLDTGQILNWRKPDDRRWESLAKVLSGEVDAE